MIEWGKLTDPPEEKPEMEFESLKCGKTHDYGSIVGSIPTLITIVLLNCVR